MSNMDPQMDLRIRSLIEYAEAHGHDVLILARRTPTSTEDDDLPEGYLKAGGPTALSAFAIGTADLLSDSLARAVEHRVGKEGECPSCEMRACTLYAYDVVHGFTATFHEDIDEIREWCMQQVAENPCEEDE